MGKVRFEISTSLDGYVTAASPTLEEPMGRGGKILHQLAFSADHAGRRAVEESQASVGASIAGRKTYDLSIRWWQADGPGGELRTPTFIVSHSQPDDVPDGGVYTFASSPEQALDAALEVAGDKDVDIFSANIGQQLLAAGRVDEVHLHVVPMLLGAGTRLIDDLSGRHVRLRRLNGTESDAALHLRFAVVKDR
jgi:dihydrofolate reductase